MSNVNIIEFSYSLREGFGWNLLDTKTLKPIKGVIEFEVICRYLEPQNTS